MNKENGENNEGEGKERENPLSVLAALFVPTIRPTLQPIHT